MALHTKTPLQAVPLFAGVPAETLARYGLRATERRLAGEENLVVAGEPRTRVWFLRSGWVRVRVHSPGGVEATAAILGPDEVFACTGCCGLQTHPFTITALTDAEVLSVPAPAFERWLRGDADAAWRIIGVHGALLRESLSLRAVNAERAPVRLRLTLGWLSRKFGPEIPATRALLADLTGLRAETCSRVLSDLARRGVLRASPRRIRILRPERLDVRAGRR